jgi:hypothetical protein
MGVLLAAHCQPYALERAETKSRAQWQCSRMRFSPAWIRIVALRTSLWARGPSLRQAKPANFKFKLDQTKWSVRLGPPTNLKIEIKNLEVSNFKDFKVFKLFNDFKDVNDFKDFKVFKLCKDFKVFKDFKLFQDFKLFKGLPGFSSQKALIYEDSWGSS